jgi:hypothetical protein
LRNKKKVQPIQIDSSDVSEVSESSSENSDMSYHGGESLDELLPERRLRRPQKRNPNSVRQTRGHKENKEQALENLVKDREKLQNKEHSS